jgi:hypothetical protein
MLKMLMPGHSMFSQVPISICDESCQTKTLCDNPADWRCKKPLYDKDLYEKYLHELGDEKEATLRSFTRPETFEEGVVRYSIIATAAAEVSEQMTRHLCKKRCDIASSNAYGLCSDVKIEDTKQCQDDTENQSNVCYNQCVIDSPWLWTRKEIAYMGLTVLKEESGFRADVHGGTGPAGKGDCKWAYENGAPAPAWAKNAHRVPGTCKSVCLGQINIGEGTIMPWGWTADDLIGVDLASTKRCFSAVTKIMSLSKNQCLRSQGNKDIAKATFAAYGSGSSCTIRQKKTVLVHQTKQEQYAFQIKENGSLKVVWSLVPPDNSVSKEPLEEYWPTKRANIFNTFFAQENKIDLESNIKDLLEDERIIDAFSKLKEARNATPYMMPIKPKNNATSPYQLAIYGLMQ